MKAIGDETSCNRRQRPEKGYSVWGIGDPHVHTSLHEVLRTEYGVPSWFPEILRRILARSMRIHALPGTYLVCTIDTQVRRPV